MQDNKDKYALRRLKLGREKVVEELRDQFIFSPRPSHKSKITNRSQPATSSKPVSNPAPKKPSGDSGIGRPIRNDKQPSGNLPNIQTFITNCVDISRALQPGTDNIKTRKNFRSAAKSRRPRLKNNQLPPLTPAQEVREKLLALVKIFNVTLKLLGNPPKKFKEALENLIEKPDDNLKTVRLHVDGVLKALKNAVCYLNSVNSDIKESLGGIKFDNRQQLTKSFTYFGITSFHMLGRLRLIYGRAAKFFQGVSILGDYFEKTQENISSILITINSNTRSNLLKSIEQRTGEIKGSVEYVSNSLSSMKKYRNDVLPTTGVNLRLLSKRIKKITDILKEKKDNTTTTRATTRTPNNRRYSKVRNNGLTPTSRRSVKRLTTTIAHLIDSKNTRQSNLLNNKRKTKRTNKPKRAVEQINTSISRIYDLFHKMEKPLNRKTTPVKNLILIKEKLIEAEKFAAQIKDKLKTLHTQGFNKVWKALRHQAYAVAKQNIQNHPEDIGKTIGVIREALSKLENRK